MDERTLRSQRRYLGDALGIGPREGRRLYRRLAAGAVPESREQLALAENLALSHELRIKWLRAFAGLDLIFAAAYGFLALPTHKSGGPGLWILGASAVLWAVNGMNLFVQIKRMRRDITRVRSTIDRSLVR